MNPVAVVRTRAWLVVAKLAALGILLPSSVVEAWSSSPLLHSTTGISRSRDSSLSFRPQAATLRASLLVRSVQARAVDIDDRQVITEQVESAVASDSTVEGALETSLDTAAIDTDMRELAQKILNGIFLAVCFGWAAYTILNIDAGMTRGWTQSEIAMRIPLDTWSSYETSLMEKPIFTKTLINVVIYTLGDWLSQTVFARKGPLDFDVSRTLKNGFIGLCFGPLVHQYYAFSDHILPVEGGIMNRVEKILMDQTIYLTVKCSIYICAVGLLRGDDFDTCKQTVKEKIRPIVLTAWKFWPLVHCITYSVIPARHRILWVNCVDLVWNAILATKAQKDQPEVAKIEADEIIKESADALVLASASDKDPLAAIAVPAQLSNVKETIEELSAGHGHETRGHSPPVVQEVALTGTHIKIEEDGVPVLVSADDEDARVPIISNITFAT